MVNKHENLKGLFDWWLIFCYVKLALRQTTLIRECHSLLAVLTTNTTIFRLILPSSYHFPSEFQFCRPINCKMGGARHTSNHPYCTPLSSNLVEPLIRSVESNWIVNLEHLRWYWCHAEPGLEWWFQSHSHNDVQKPIRVPVAADVYQLSSLGGAQHTTIAICAIKFLPTKLIELNERTEDMLSLCISSALGWNFPLNYVSQELCCRIQVYMLEKNYEKNPEASNWLINGSKLPQK